MYSVMLVDDEDIIVRGLEKLIGWEDYGLEITATASNGEQAWAILQEKPCDILITDIRMPYMDGIELLRHVFDQNMPLKAIVVSGYDDFGYVKKALRFGIENYLLKPIDEEELSATLLTAIEKLDAEQKDRRIRQHGVDTLLDHVVYRWMTGTISQEELRGRAELIGMDLGAAWYTALLIRAQEDIYPITPQWKKLAHGLLDMDGRLCFSATSTTLLVLLMSEEQPAPDALREKLEAAFSGEASVSVGMPVQHSQNVFYSYQDASQSLAWESLLSSSASDYLRHLTADAEHGALVKTTENLSHQINQARKSGDIAASDEALDALFDTLTALSAHSEPAARKLLFNTLPRLFNPEDSIYWQAHKIDLDPQKRLDAAALMNARAAVKTAVRAYDQHSGSSGHPIIEKIYQYVFEHYAEDISLKKLSGELHFSPAYLGQLFKQHSGQLFLEYVCDFRIGKAKALLLETTYKSYDIAKMVGFRNANYFANVFQKMTGVYPTVYRRQAASEAVKPVPPLKE